MAADLPHADGPAPGALSAVPRQRGAGGRDGSGRPTARRATTSAALPSTPPAPRGDPRADSGASAWLVFCGLFAVAAVLGVARPLLPLGAAVAVMAAAVAACAWRVRPLAALLAGPLAWLLANGYLVDRAGELRWHGTSDLARLAVLVGAAVTASALRGLRLRHRAGARPDRRPAANGRRRAAPLSG